MAGPGHSRCFVAVEPPPGLVSLLEGLPRPAVAGVRWTDSHQWHVTLRFFTSVDTSALVDALASLVFAAGPVVALAGPRPFALSRSVWALPVSGLETLAGAVETSVVLRGLAQPEARPFRGHLTLARSRRPGAVSGLPAPEVSFEWPVTSIFAVASELRPEGARHTVLARRALGASGR